MVRKNKGQRRYPETSIEEAGMKHSVISRNDVDKAIVLVLIFIVSSAVAVEAPHSKTVEELELSLFKDYQKDVVPKRFADKGLKVLLDLALYQIKDVDKRGQTMTAVIWVRQYWTDYRLSWNASEYNGTMEIVTKANRIWLPDITLYNNARDDYSLADETDKSLTIKPNGGVSRFFPTIYKSSCKMSVKLFPFDDQVCKLQLGSWSYNIKELDLYNKGNGDTQNFLPNGEWVLLRMPSERAVTRFRCCPHPYPYVVYNIHLRRKALYYIVNCFTPCIIMLGLTVLGFFLPTESGERMGVGITVLLSLSIIQLMLSDSLPPTSEVPLLVEYYGITMVNVFTSLVFTCAVMCLYHHRLTPLPLYIRVGLCEWGSSILRMRKQWNRIQEMRQSPEYEFVEEHNAQHENGEVRHASVCWNPERYPQSQTLVELSKEANQQEEKPLDSATEFLTKRWRREDEEELWRQEWRFASQVLNRGFMWITVLLVLLNTFFLLIRAPMANLKTV